MFQFGIGNTGLWTCAVRIRETKRPDGLFKDEYAEKFGGEGVNKFLGLIETKIKDPKIRDSLLNRNTHFVLREKFFEDFLLQQIQSGKKQFVIGAAGLDSRPFRFEWPQGAKVFTLDQPEIMAYKEQKIKEFEMKPKCERIALPADLTKDDWKSRMEEKGFDRKIPTVWIFCGLLPYLEQPIGKDLLARLASFTGPGSLIAFDVPEHIQTQTNSEILQLLKECESPVIAAFLDVQALLEEYGWHVVKRLKPGDPEINYGRWVDDLDKGIPWDGLFIVAERQIMQACLSCGF
jgi:methyltransferase (TIGR00027 family)